MSCLVIVIVHVYLIIILIVLLLYVNNNYFVVLTIWNAIYFQVNTIYILTFEPDSKLPIYISIMKLKVELYRRLCRQWLAYKWLSKAILS